MVETSPNPVCPDTRSEEEKLFDADARDYSAIPEPVSEKDNPDALFANGWGRRGHFALLVAPSGVGKSVISTQLLVPWASGRPGLVGSAPLIPLRIAVIQAEDDDTEMAEFRRDHRQGHLAEGWKLEDIIAAEKKVQDWSRFFRGKIGGEFIKWLDFALRRQPSDVVILNPLQSYAGIDLNKNAELSEFLRKQLDPILARQRAFMLCVHHTNKPQTNAAKGDAWGADDLSAYIGAGGAELTNYARSVTFIRRCTPKECGVENSFMLIGAKRGNRLGWKDAEGKKTNKRIIAYSENYIHWRVPTPEEIEAAGGTAGRAKKREEPLSAQDASDMIAGVICKEWPKKGIVGFVRDRLCSQMTRGEFAAGWDFFLAHLVTYGMMKVDDGNKSYHFEPTLDAEPQGLPGLGGEDAAGDLDDDENENYWQR